MTWLNKDEKYKGTSKNRVTNIIIYSNILKLNLRQVSVKKTYSQNKADKRYPSGVYCPNNLRLSSKSDESHLAPHSEIINKNYVSITYKYG